MAPKREQKNNMLLRVAGYVRISHIESLIHGYSVGYQKAAIKKYAKANGMVITKWYIDEAKSGSKNQSRRTEFQRLINDVKAGKIDFILFSRLDRWFRNTRHFYRVEDILEEHGNVRWKATEEEYDNFTKRGQELLGFKILMAQAESDRISERINFTFENMLAEGKPINGNPPYGYKIDGEAKHKKIIKDPDAEDIVNDVFDYYELYRSKRATGKYISEKYGFVMSYNRITKILTNTFYYGEYKGYPDYAPAYISKERYDNIQQLIKNNVRQTKKRRTYIFSGLVRCGHCGSRGGSSVATNTYGKEYKFYRCNTFNNHGRCVNRKSISEVKIEKYLLENIIAEVENYEVTARVEEGKKPKPKTNKSAIQGKIDRVQQMYKDGFMEYEKFKEEFSDLKAQLEKAEKEEKQFEVRDLSDIKNLFEGDFMELYSTLDDNEKSAFWGKVITGAGGEIKIYKDGSIRLFF